MVETRRTADGVTRITLNRPEKANALDELMVAALLDAFAAAQTDGTRLLILDAAGKHFCAGFDLGNLDDCSDGDLLLRFVRVETALQALYHLPFPTLALAKGRAMGAGADLFAACGRRVAAPGTQFRMPGLAFGILLGTRRLAARIGVDAARRIQNETRTFDASEALALGFATDIAEEPDWPPFIDAATAAANTLAPEATAALFRATAPDTRAEDMADLSASASSPGLKQRIQAYRDAMKR
ncbi:MAG: enoyl-CoA hydratase/isomerase family protein [Alphaproteobacteria bacterium]|nr:enoyl-CoA hydratase/isomerase family protein [Alphaproteobacteria bacterium]